MSSFTVVDGKVLQLKAKENYFMVVRFNEKHKKSA